MKSCNICQKEFSNSVNLNGHVRKHHKSTNIFFNCDKCEFISPSKKYLKEHNQSVHLGIKINCNMCDYQTGLKSNLNSHISSTHKIRSKVKCKYCTYETFIQNSSKTKRQKM